MNPDQFAADEERYEADMWTLACMADDILGHQPPNALFKLARAGYNFRAAVEDGPGDCRS